MEKKFNSDEVPLAQMLSQAQTGQLQLPDFQRGWVWDDDHITSLLASISLSYPIGSVMTLQTGNPDVKFRPRPLEGVELNGEVEPEILLLDGQQRTTSLFLALMSGQPVPTRDSKGNDLKRLYYADIKKCIDPMEDREDAIFSVPPDGILKTFRGEVRLDVSNRQQEIEQELFPLSIVLDQIETTNWMLEYLNSGPGINEQRLETWSLFHAAVVSQFIQYQVPSIQLVKSTPKEAVCQVFEKVNTGGVSLTVFELLTATYAADSFNLRDDWTERSERWKNHEVLNRFEATEFLQIVTLLTTYHRRREFLAAQADGHERAPAVSCKRRDMLRLELSDYQQWADIATDALERTVPFLHSEHIFNGRDLPYATQIVPLTAIFAILGEDAEGQGIRKLIRRWFWCGVFGEMYGGSTETRFALDLQDVVAWVRDDADEPRTIREAQFQADRLLTLRTRLSAAYKGLFALQMKRGARDFRTGNTIDVHAYVDDAIDIHHIFPKKWCAEHGIDAGITDSVVNKTAIDRKTNGRIGGRAPSEYLSRIESGEGIDSIELDAILHSHDIDPIALRQDDMASFFNKRFERLIKQIEEAMGKPANRSADRAESPFANSDVIEAHRTRSLLDLMQRPENKVLEFKSTGRKNLNTGEKDAAIEWSVVKTIAGFMNSTGGTLLVGVDDDGAPVGIEADYPFLKKPDEDGWSLWLNDLISNSLGKVAATDIEVVITAVDGCSIARVDVGPSPTPVFAVPSKGDKREHFFVRTSNSTQELQGSSLVDYQKKRWP